MLLGLLPACWMSQHLVADSREERDEGAGPDGDAASRDDGASLDDAESEHDAAAEDGSPGDAAAADDAGEVEAGCPDHDGDGHAASECGGDDCDDDDPTVFPGAVDACDDGRDSDCDGLDAHAGLLGPPVLLLDHPPTGGNLYTELLWTGRAYLLTWNLFDGDGIYLERVDVAGRPFGAEVRMRPWVRKPHFAWAADRVGAVWCVIADDGSTEGWFQAFDESGVPLEEPVRLTWDGAGVGCVYRIAAAGADFFVVLGNNTVEGVPRGIRVTRLGPDGTVRFAPVEVASFEPGTFRNAWLASSGEDAAVVWGLGDTWFVQSVRLRNVDWTGEFLGSERVLSLAQAPIRGVPRTLRHAASRSVTGRHEE